MTQKGKTPEYSKRAQRNYMQRQKEMGFIVYSRKVKKEWTPQLDAFLERLKEQSGSGQDVRQKAATAVNKNISADMFD